MMLNPYITQHYGSSVELMFTQRGEDEEGEEVNAAIGFRRFPKATHMTHTVFKPKNAPPAAASSDTPPPPPIHAAAALPSQANTFVNGANNSPRADVSDVLASLRLNRGVLIDGFPSRPLTPKGNNSFASLPPLLPADRLSVGSNDSLRDHGAGLLHNWVKTTAPTNSSSSSSSSSSPACAPSPAPVEKPNNGAVAAAMTSPAANDTREKSVEEAPAQPTDGFTRRGMRASPPRLPVTAAAFFKAVPPSPSAGVPDASGAAVDLTAPSVSISPVSLHPDSNAKSTPTNETPVATPEPEGVGGDTMAQMLHRSRLALEHVQRVLGETPASATATTAAAAAADSCPLAPPPPLSPLPQKAQPSADAELPGVAVVAAGSTPPAEKSPEDSLNFVSPLSANHNGVWAFPASAGSGAGEFGGQSRVSASSALLHRRETNTTVSEETRYMVLCRVADPTTIVKQRMRRRNPNRQQHQLQQQQHREATSPAPHVCETRVGAAVLRTHLQATVTSLHSQPAEVPRAPAVAAAHPLLPISSADSSIHTALAATPPRRKSSLPLAAAATPPAGVAPRTLHEDPSLLQELADFLRAGNASGFSSLSAALSTPAAAASRTPVTRSPHTHAKPHRRPSNARVVAAPPPPAVLLGNPPPVSAVQFGRSFTPSSQLARVNTHDTTAAGVSPHHPSVLPHHSRALPSYAQPTISWLSKGSEASADDFPVTHATTALQSSTSEPKPT